MLASFEDRIGASMRRAPYVWLTATVLLFFVMNSTLRAIVKNESHTNTAISIGAAAFSAYSIVVWLMLPRMVLRAKKPMPPVRTAVTRWLLALIAYFVGFVAVIAGGKQWCYGLGFVVSVVLLALTARWIRKDASATAT